MEDSNQQQSNVSSINNSKRPVSTTEKIAIYIVTIIAFIGGYLIITYLLRPPSLNLNSNTQNCPACISTNDHPDYDTLKKDACSLYKNYSQMYLNADKICNGVVSCRGSAMQKEAYDTFKTWDTFHNDYCDE